MNLKTEGTFNKINTKWECWFEMYPISSVYMHILSDLKICTILSLCEFFWSVILTSIHWGSNNPSLLVVTYLFTHLFSRLISIIYSF